MEVLRFITCGSVDDGKSTLIGRLLYDSNAIQTDLLEAIEQSSRRNGSSSINLALLTDGLKSEREQGITIDTAYKYFNTKDRKFIITDSPGHVQYTRNMVTGASTAQLAILLIDASKGIVEQTRRHATIASFLGLPHVLLAINKIDLVDYSREVFESIRKDFLEFAQHFSLGFQDIQAIPISALHGDNVVHPSKQMPWYLDSICSPAQENSGKGMTLMEYLHAVPIEGNENLEDPRFFVQTVIRAQSSELPNYRAYAGRINGGVFRPNDRVQIWPSGLKSRIRSIQLGEKECKEAFAPMSVSFVLEDELDISRGDLLTTEDHTPSSGQEFSARICWMSQEPLSRRSKYILRHGTRELPIVVQKIEYCMDLRTLERVYEPESLAMNDLAVVRLKSASVLYYDPYAKNKRSGAFILIESVNYAVAAGGMFLDDESSSTTR